jgi:hypothetical protein
MATATILKRSLFGLLSTVALTAPVLALFSLTATRASAAPLSYDLPCQVNQWDGVALAGGKIMVRNTTGRTIPQDTNIELTVEIRPVAFARVRYVTSTVVAYRNVYVNEDLSSGDTPSGGRSCTAKVSFLRRGSLDYTERNFQRVVVP